MNYSAAVIFLADEEELGRIPAPRPRLQAVGGVCAFFGVVGAECVVRCREHAVQ